MEKKNCQAQRYESKETGEATSASSMRMQTELEERGGHFPKGLGGSALGVQQAVLLKVGWGSYSRITDADDGLHFPASFALRLLFPASLAVRLYFLASSTVRRTYVSRIRLEVVCTISRPDSLKSTLHVFHVIFWLSMLI